MKVLIGIVVGLFATSTFAAGASVGEGESTITPAISCPLGHTGVIEKTGSTSRSISVKVSCAPVICVVNKIPTALDKVPDVGPVLGLFQSNKLRVSIYTDNGRKISRHNLIRENFGEKAFDKESEARKYADDIMYAGGCNSVKVKKFVVY